MKLSLTRFACLMTGVLCAVTVLALVVGGPRSGVARAATPATAKRPALTVTTLSGRPFHLKAQRGKWVIVNYWATWCGPCIKELPALSAFVASHPDVTAIGLAYEDKPVSKIHAFLSKHPVHYPIARINPLHPPKGIAMPRVLPTTFLVAPNGKLARKFIGPLNLHKLAAAIGGKASGP